METEEVEVDPVFKAMTRPPMFWGVTYSALVLYVMSTFLVFLWTKDLRAFLLFPPLHGVAYLLCLYDAHIFEVLSVRASTMKPCPNRSFWGMRTFQP